MIIICFQGGLGNQMFQYAYYRELKYLFPDIKIMADIYDFQSEMSLRKYELDFIFDINLPIATKFDVIRLSNRIPGNGKLTFIRRKTSEKLANIFRTTPDKLYPHYFFLESEVKRDFKINQNYYLEGFWHTEEAFSDVRDEVVADFRKPLDDRSAAKINLDEYISGWKDNNTVGVHIRRTDYLMGEVFIKLSTGYYKRAIEYVSERVKNPLFVFFSDDIDYVKKNFNWVENKKIITKNTGDNSYKDMLLMAECNHNIIANSTFSYWGAYLNKNPEKIVIAPEQYLKNDSKPLAAKDWVLLPLE